MSLSIWATSKDSVLKVGRNFGMWLGMWCLGWSLGPNKKSLLFPCLLMYFCWFSSDCQIQKLGFAWKKHQKIYVFLNEPWEIPSDPSLQLAPKQAKEFYGRHGRFGKTAEKLPGPAPIWWSTLQLTAANWSKGYVVNKCTPATNKFNSWFGARWFGIQSSRSLGVPLEINNSFSKGDPKIFQSTRPQNHQGKPLADKCNFGNKNIHNCPTKTTETWGQNLISNNLGTKKITFENRIQTASKTQVEQLEKHEIPYGFGDVSPKDGHFLSPFLDASAAEHWGTPFFFASQVTDWLCRIRKWPKQWWCLTCLYCHM